MKTTNTQHPRLYPAVKEQLLKQANEMLANSTASPEFRQGVCVYIELILMKFGCYRGFEYLTKEQVPPEQLPGIRDSLRGTGTEFTLTDNTRRKYL